MMFMNNVLLYAIRNTDAPLRELLALFYIYYKYSIDDAYLCNKLYNV